MRDSSPKEVALWRVRLWGLASRMHSLAGSMPEMHTADSAAENQAAANVRRAQASCG